MIGSIMSAEYRIVRHEGIKDRVAHILALVIGIETIDKRIITSSKTDFRSMSDVLRRANVSRVENLVKKEIMFGSKQIINHKSGDLLVGSFSFSILDTEV